MVLGVRALRGSDYVLIRKPDFVGSESVFVCFKGRKTEDLEFIR